MIRNLNQSWTQVKVVMITNDVFRSAELVSL
jgi:hypothetical protein